MRIGQLAAATGVSADTIRYYERIGLLPSPARTDSGYRAYPPGAANRVRVIRNAVQLGFPLAEVAKVLRVRDAGGAPCRQVRDYAQALVAQIDDRIRQLEADKQAMVAMIRQWDGQLARAQGARANLLEAAEIPGRAPRPKHLRLRQSR